MNRFRTGLIAALGLSFFFSVATSVAQEQQRAPSGAQTKNAIDENQIRKELSSWALVGQQQILYLSGKAIDQYEPTLLDGDPNMPGAWMLMDDGKTVKRISIDDKAGSAPAKIRLLMYRAALKSIARRDKINAAVILYTGKIKEGSDDEALVVEHEHRLGISANKVIPYRVLGGKVSYSKSATTKKPFQIFYEEMAEGQALSSKNEN